MQFFYSVVRGITNELDKFLEPMKISKVTNYETMRTNFTSLT